MLDTLEPTQPRNFQTERKKGKYCLGLYQQNGRVPPAWASVQNSKAQYPVSVRWITQTQGWHKLNSDDSSKENPGPEDSGGVIRDNGGYWIMGYSRNIGH